MVREKKNEGKLVKKYDLKELNTYDLVMFACEKGEVNGNRNMKEKDATDMKLREVV